MKITRIVDEIQDRDWSKLYTEVYNKPTGFHTIESMKKHIKTSKSRIKNMIQSYGIDKFKKEYKSLTREQYKPRTIYLNGTGKELIKDWFKLRKAEYDKTK